MIKKDKKGSTRSHSLHAKLSHKKKIKHDVSIKQQSNASEEEYQKKLELMRIARWKHSSRSMPITPEIGCQISLENTFMAAFGVKQMLLFSQLRESSLQQRLDATLTKCCKLQEERIQLWNKAQALHDKISSFDFRQPAAESQATLAAIAKKVENCMVALEKYHFPKLVSDHKVMLSRKALASGAEFRFSFSEASDKVEIEEEEEETQTESTNSNSCDETSTYSNIVEQDEQTNDEFEIDPDFEVENFAPSTWHVMSNRRSSNLTIDTESAKKTYKAVFDVLGTLQQTIQMTWDHEDTNVLYHYALMELDKAERTLESLNELTEMLASEDGIHKFTAKKRSKDKEYMAEVEEYVDKLIQQINSKTLFKGNDLSDDSQEIMNSLSTLIGKRQQRRERLKTTGGIIFSDSSNFKNAVQQGWQATKLDFMKAATTDRLIEMLINQQTSTGRKKLEAKQFFLIFFTTYRYFMSTTSLLEKIFMKYCTAPPSLQTGDTEAARTHSTRVLPLRIRILQLLRDWIAEYKSEDFNDPKYKQLLLDFLENTVSCSGNSKIAAQLKDMLLTESPEEAKVADEIARVRTLSKDYSPDDLAIQLTVYDYNLFKHVRWRELTFQRWNKKNRLEEAPALSLHIAHFNRISEWVTWCILQPDKAEMRAQVLRHCTVLALHLYKLNNFNALFAVLSGTNSAAITRLRRTWSLTGENYFVILEQLKLLMVSNFSFYRKALNELSATMPCVPYTGMFLTDLTFLEDGNPTIVDKTKVNFFKMQHITNIITRVIGYQKNQYKLDENIEIQAAISQLPHFPSSTNTYEASKELEPPSETRQYPKVSFKVPEEELEGEWDKVRDLKNHPILIEFEECPLKPTDMPAAKHLIKSDSEEQEEISTKDVALCMALQPIIDIAGQRIASCISRMAYGGVQLRTRTWRLKTYPHSFVGEEAVTWMVNNLDWVSTRESAVTFGRSLVKEGYIAHASSEMTFYDKHVYYIFTPKAKELKRFSVE